MSSGSIIANDNGKYECGECEMEFTDINAAWNHTCQNVEDESEDAD